MSKKTDQPTGASILANGSGAPTGPRVAPGGDPRLDMALRNIGFAPTARAGAAPPFAAPATPAPTADAGREAAVALARRDWLMDVMETQRRLSAAASGLWRVEGLSGPEFLDQFYAPGRPCLIKGAIAHWPALERWTPDYLRAAVGDAPVEYQGDRQGAGDFELAKDRHKQRLPFRAYLDLIERTPGNDAYVTAYNSAANQAAFAPLMADTRPIADYLTPGGGMLWIGPAGTFTPLHFDLTNNLLVQVTGRKHVLLVPSTQARFLYHRRHVFSDVHDLEDPARLQRYPLARRATPYAVTLEPGDLLFIPIGWWHQVRALDFSVMLTYTNFLWPNAGYESFPAD